MFHIVPFSAGDGEHFIKPLKESKVANNPSPLICVPEPLPGIKKENRRGCKHSTPADLNNLFHFTRSIAGGRKKSLLSS